MPVQTRNRGKVPVKRPAAEGELETSAASRRKVEPAFKMDYKNPCASLKVGMWVTCRNTICCIVKLHPEKSPQMVRVVHPSTADKSKFIKPEG
jgi:hypothetical protein